MIAHLGNYCVGLWVLLRIRLVNFAIRVDYKNLAIWNPNFSITNCVRFPVSQAGIKRVHTLWEKIPYIAQWCNLKNLWLLENNLSVEAAHQTIRRLYHGTRWERDALLPDVEDVIFSRFSLPDSPGSQVKYLIAIRRNLLKQICNSRLGPVISKLRENMPKHIWLCYCAINVGNNDFLSPFPQVDVTGQCLNPLQGARNLELNCVCPRFQVKTLKLLRGWR